MGKNDRPVLVVGAGVSGLTTAITLAEAGLSVRVLAALPPLQTTSAAAGASWAPYLVSHRDARRWSDTTLDILREFSGQAATGVNIVGGIEASKVPVAPPEWASGLPSFRLCDASELPCGYTTGWWFEVPVITMPIYLTYLTERLKMAGVSLEPGRVDSWESVCGKDRVVVNCTGAAAGRLCADPEVIPTKGQVVVVENPGLTTFFQDHAEDREDLVYFLPHGDHVILGGSAKKGVTDLTPNMAIAEAIIARCARIEPRLVHARVLGHRVGLRPSRTEVRLELEKTSTGPLVHNYGHGGAGVTLSWGCAQTILELVSC